MVVKNLDCTITGSKSPRTLTVDTSGSDTARAKLTKFRDYRPSSLAFCAELHDGRVRVEGSPIGQNMADQLNQLRKGYRLDPDPDSARKKQGLRIVDDKLSVFHIQSTAAAGAVFKSSRTLVAHSAPITSPGRAHLGQVSGIQTTAEGSQFRLIKQHLHRFEPDSLTWIADQDTQPYSRIGLTREGLLMKVPLGLRDRSVNAKTQMSLEQSAGGSSLHLQCSGQAAGRRFTPVSESGEAVQLMRIGLAGDVLYASNPEGELLRGGLHTAEGGRLTMRPEPTEALERRLGGDVSFKGFMHDDEGRLNALLLDRHQQLHSCPLTDRACLLADWNLSDVLLNVIDKGIPGPDLRALAGAVDLGPRGKVALEGGTLLSWDPSAQRWDHTDQVDVDHLERGLDGFAYVLQAGQLKTLGTQKGQEPIHLGASYDLAAPNAACRGITLGVLAGDAARVISGFAVVNGGCFVSLDSTHQLRAHIDGKETVLRFAEPKQIQMLALDAHGNLYAQSRAGELLTLDKTHWQNASSGKVAWTPVMLPDNERLKSLRMGADNQLIASWGENNPQLNRWGEKYKQLSISDQGHMQWEPLVSSGRENARSLSSILREGEIKGNFNSTSWAATSGFLGQKTEGVDSNRGLLKGVRAHMQPLGGIQHRPNGRAGMEGLYDADKRVRSQLKSLANAKPAGLDMMARLDLVRGSELTQAVVSTLKDALALVEKNSRSAAIKLGDLRGVRGLLAPAVPGTGREKQTSASSLAQMRQAFENLSPSTANATAALLRGYEAQRLSLPACKPDNTRDLTNPTALLESDLIHHAQTLSQLGLLVSTLEGRSPDLEPIAQSLEGVMSAYHDNPVHKRVSQNINGYGQAERLYHNFKLLAKDLGTPGSALNFHIARLLGVSGKEGVKQALLQEIQRAESGQSITPAREKSMGAGLLAYGIPPIPFLDFYVGVSKAKANAVTLTRTDTGVNVEIKTNSTSGAKAAVGAGVTLAPVGGRLGGGVRVGVEVGAAVARDTGASVSFSVKQTDFSKMMDILVGEGGDVYDLLDLGTDHTSSQSSKTSVDLGLSGLVQGRGHFMLQEGGGQLDSLVRAVAGLSLNLNLLHGEKSRTVTQGQDQISKTQGGDLQFFNKGGLTLGAGPFNTLTGANIESGGSDLGSSTAAEIALSISFDRSVAHTFSFTFKQPSAVSHQQVSDLQGELSRFSAPLRQGVQGLPQAGAEIEAQLKKLQDVFENTPVPAAKIEEHFVLRNRLNTLLQQQRLVTEGKRALTSVESTVTYVGLSGDAKHSWMDDAAVANKTAIVELMKKQPLVAQMIKDLERSTGTSASIRLEVKPDVLRMIENSVADGRDARQDIELALKNPDNLRIKNMSVSGKASRSHGMALALPVLNLSSTASLTHSQKVFDTVFEYGSQADVPLRMTRNDVVSTPGVIDLNPELREQNIRTARRSEY